MNSRVSPVSLREFKYILQLARIAHQEKNEPIPVPKDDNWERVDSCLRSPFQVVFGSVLYRGFLNKASALFYFIIKNHPLANGNKRMACLTLGYLCAKNNRELTIDNDDLIELARYTAMSEAMNKDACIQHIRHTLQQHIREVA